MLNILKSKLLIFVAMLTLTVPVIIPVGATAAGACGNNVGSGINRGVSDTGSSLPCGQGGSITSGVASLARKVINIFSIVVGVLAVIMIIYAALRYITSGGESGGVQGAKNTLLYAVIGLVIAVLAQIIVRYVLNTASGVGNNVSGT